MAPKPPNNGQVALVVGASRGIGRQISITLSHAGYTVVVSSKSTSPSPGTPFNASAPFPPDPNSPASTITTVAREIGLAGGRATAIPVDVRSYDSIRDLFRQIVEKHGRLDVLVYNSGAIWWESVAKTPMSRFQLMQRVNVEGLYGCVQEALPVFERQGWRGRVVVVSPPIYSRFFRGKAAYAVGKVGMSVLVKGLAMDWEREGKGEMGVTGVWPAVAIESAATKQLTDRDPEKMRDLRSADIFADAVLAILSAPAAKVNGLLTLDEDFLREFAGVTDFSKYSKVPGSSPRRIMPARFPDLTVEEQDDEGDRHTSTGLRSKL